MFRTHRLNTEETLSSSIYIQLYRVYVSKQFYHLLQNDGRKANFLEIFNEILKIIATCLLSILFF